MLIIDDDDGIREVAKMSLELVAGWEVVDRRRRAPRASARPRESRPEGILLDVMMPGLDGPATLASCAPTTPSASTPVIFLTAKVQAAERTRFAELDVAGLIAKPFDPMKLASQIAELFGWAP